MAVPTLAALLAHLNMTPASGTGELTVHLAAARRLVERHVGPLEPVAITQTIRCRGSQWNLSTLPVVSLDDVTASVGGATIDADSLSWDARSGVVRSTTGASLAGTWLVEYTAGLASVPEAVELATYVTAQHLWRSQRGGGVRPGLADDGALQSTGGAGFALPWMAVELLAADEIVLGFA